MSLALSTRCSLLLFLLTAVGINCLYADTLAPTDHQMPVIQILASRYRFEPAKIVVKKGQAVILEIQSSDRLHGFAIPGLGLRSDARPGQMTRVAIKPEKTGTLTYFCDVFCGSGHEQMSGEIVVE
ncbi:MAG: cupredoxin domain-containing protein [Methylococcaceae bacterium]|jgi:cytochrome c oxidase subunit 2